MQIQNLSIPGCAKPDAPLLCRPFRPLEQLFSIIAVMGETNVRPISIGNLNESTFAPRIKWAHSLGSQLALAEAETIHAGSLRAA